MSNASTTNARDTRGRAPYQWLALVVGAAYLLVGIAGWFVTGFEDWFAFEPGQDLLGFAINPMHNVVHLLIGIAGIALASSRGGARTFGWLLVVGYGAALVYGLFVAGQEDGNFLNINTADNWLHAVSVIAGLAIALWPDRDRNRAAVADGDARTR